MKADVTHGSGSGNDQASAAAVAPGHPGEGVASGAAPEHALLDLLPDAVVIADARGRVTATNALARTWLGSPGACTGRTLATVLSLQNQDGEDWISTNRPYGGLMTRTALTEQVWLLPDGTEVLVAAKLHRDSRQGPVQQVAVTLRNGRGRKVLDRERSDLVATVAHELRSPLTGVKGFVTTLLNKWDLLHDDQKKLMLTTVSADSERLSRLITELLDVARIDTGRLPLYPRDIDPVPIVRRVVDLAGSSTARPIDADALLDEDVQIFADPDKFAQVMTNLVDNALRHGSGQVRLSLQPGPDEVVFVVDDEGDGIDEEIRTRVFTKFWKYGTGGGSGLGMYIVGGLTSAHGGRVGIESSPSGGARVLVRWPRGDRR